MILKFFTFYIILISFCVIFYNSVYGQGKELRDTLNNNRINSADTLGSKDIHPQDSPESSGLIIRSKDKKLSIRFYGSARVYGSYDFNGTDNKFRIRQAYGQTKHLIIGQTWTNFSDIETLPLTVDVDGPPTAVSVRNVQIKYYLDFEPGWRFRASIESPSILIYIPDTLSIESVTQNYPAVATNIKKDWEAVQIKAAGILNPISVRNVSGERGSLLGRGALLSINADLTSSSSLKFQGLFGKGIASFLNLSDNSAFDVVLNPNDGEYQLTTCYGGFVAFNQEIFREFLDIDIVYGLVNLTMEDYFPDYSFNAGQYIAFNGFLSYPGGFRLGVEYTYGYKKIKDGSSGVANRFAFTFYYDF